MADKTIIFPEGSNGNGGAHYRLSMTVPKRRYLSYLRERWWILLACLAVATGGMVAYETFRSDTYSSYAQLYTSGEVQLNVASIFNEESQTYFGTQIELLKSSRLQNAALAKTGYVPGPGQSAAIKFDVVQPMRTSILLLQAKGADPVLTQHFLQALIEEYLAYKKETRLSTSEDIVASLTDQLARKEKDLKAEQDRLAEFQTTNNVAVLEDEGKSAGLYLADLNMQLGRLKLDRQLLSNGLSLRADAAPVVAANATNAAVAADKSIPESFPASSDAALKTARLQLAVARSEMNQAQTERGELAARRFAEDVERLGRTVRILEEQNLAERKANLDELDKRIAAMETSVPAWETKVLNINERLAEGQKLRNNLQREQGYYDHLLAMLQNVDLGKNVQQEKLSVLQPATPAMLVQRYLPLRIALAAFAGIGLGLGIAFAWYLSDDRFVSVHDIKDQFGETVLGLVPQIKISKSNPAEAVLRKNDERLAYAESYRHLRSAVLLASPAENRPQTVLFTGATAAEGKTTIAVNLARTLAQSGLRVVLVDADPHHGSIHHLLRSEAGVGILDYLRGEVEVGAVIHPTDLPELKFVPIGTRADHAEGLFVRPRIKELLRELRTNCDFVILDAPPVLASDDAAMLVPHADAVVLVVRPFFSRSRLVRRAMDMLYQRQAKQVTIVFNRARAEDLAGHYARNGINGGRRPDRVSS